MDSFSVVIGQGVGVAPVEARSTDPGQPGYSHGSVERGALNYAYHFLGLGEQWRDQQPVTHETALAYSAVWGCVTCISSTLAGVGWHAYKREADGRTKLPIEDNIAWLLGLQSNPEMSALAWREVMQIWALTWGNGYSEIERNGYGKPSWLWPLHPSRVTPFRDEAGALWYEVKNGPATAPTYLPPADVFHLKGPSLDGLVGLDVIGLAKRSIKLGLQEEKYGSSVFGRSPMPGGILKVPKDQKPEQRRQTRKDFEEAYSGEANSGRVLVLSAGYEFTTASLPNDSAQFLESRRFQVNEICRWFHVPPHKLADLERATFSNIEEQERSFVTNCILPWARRFEAEADIKLYGPVSRGRIFTRLNLDALLRGNSTTQTDTVTKKVTSGLLTVNEGREFFDMNPIEGGDTPLIQGAMMPLADVVDPPEELAPEPAPQPAPQPEPPTPDQAEARRVFGQLLGEAYGRMLRTDADKARRAANKGKLQDHAGEWYGADAQDRVMETLRPVYRAMALVLGWTPAMADAAARLMAARHIARCVERLAADGADGLGFCQAIADDAAAEDLREVLK